MNKKEAFQAMREGKKVRHNYFSEDEWMTIENSKIVFEDGVKCTQKDFFLDRSGPDWKDGYSIVEEKEIVVPETEESISKRKERTIDVYVPGDLEIRRGKPGFTMVRKYPKPGRNQPCPCGSGLKFKNCNHNK